MLFIQSVDSYKGEYSTAYFSKTASSKYRGLFSSLLFLMLVVLSFFANSQNLIAGWDFQTTVNGGTAMQVAPNSPTVILANVGTGSLYLNGTNGSGSWVAATSGNQLTSFAGTTLNATTGFSTVTTGAASLALVNTTANGKSMVFVLTMTGRSNLIVSYATQRTTSGFTTQVWDYSTDGLNWTGAQTVSTIPTSFAVQTLSTITGLNNAATAYIRVTFAGASSAGGNNRLDNIQFTASESSPVVASNTANGTVGIPFSYFITATNSPSSYAATGLPAGLSLNTITGEISGTPLSSLIASPVTISASNISGTGSGVLTLTIAKGTQAINFSSLPTKTYGDSSFLLTATGGPSGNPVTYTSSSPSVASISGNVVNIVGAGSTIITASQLGNSNYFAAADVLQTLNVNQATQTISFASLPSKVITDPPFALNAVGGASGNSILYASADTSVAKVIGNVVTIQGAGTTAITASQAGNSNYEMAADVTQLLTVNLLSQVINFGSLPSKLVTDPPFTLTATGGGSGNVIQYTSSNPAVATITGNIVTIVGAGVTTITASQAGNAIYSQASVVTQTLFVNAASSLVTYTFGTAANPTANPTAGVPISNLSFSAISQGNNANINQPSITLTTTSASSNSGASGEINAGITARNRNFQSDSSAYFELTLTPSAGNTVTINSLNFGSRSTSTGPTTLDIRSSATNYSTSIATISVLANSTWTLVNPVFTSLSSNGPMTLRMYGYVSGGSGSVATGASANNWRIDDIKISVSVSTSYACTLAASVTSSAINCHGGSSLITVSTTGSNGALQYQLNNNANQNSNQFANVTAGVYTVRVTDAFLCSATTIVTLTEPATAVVSASDVTACAGTPVTLVGYPAGGQFSVPNPYNGVSTSFTYTYIDSVGCISVSSPATITVTPCAVLNLKLYLQSYYIGAGMMAPVLFNQGVSVATDVTDDIIVELHDENTYGIVTSGIATLHTDGTATISFPSISGMFYLAIKHRNALQTWTSTPVLLGAAPLTYNFSTSSSKAFGNNMSEVEPGIWALYSGDLASDENIDLLDAQELEADIQYFQYGYFATDLNGDGNIDLLDFPIIEDNLAHFIFSYHPVFIVFPETMENGVKTSYTIGDVTLSTGSWNFDDALIGSSTSDRKNGAQSARIQNTGKITMNFDVVIDSASVTIWHAKYASEATSTWALYMSSNGGATWAQQGSIVTTSTTTLQSVSFTVNVTGNVRFQLRKLSGGRLNIDDVNVGAITPTIVSNDNDHLALGNPSNAVTDISFPDNYLLIKPQFDLAYNESKGSAAWVAWHLDLSDVGNTPRCDCFSTDVQIPSSFYRASSSGYAGSGFDRGHQVPSSHRNNNITDNAVTFLMSNIMPQAPNLNQITWSGLEQYCSTLINSGYELYTYSGGYGSGGTGSNGGITYTIASGHMNVPSHFWKVVVALPVGNNDLNRISTSTRVIAVDMPNTQTVNANAWGTYRTSIDAIESATGFDFLSNLPVTIQTTLEAIIDNGPTN